MACAVEPVEVLGRQALERVAEDRESESTSACKNAARRSTTGTIILGGRAPERGTSRPPKDLVLHFQPAVLRRRSANSLRRFLVRPGLCPASTRTVLPTGVTVRLVEQQLVDEPELVGGGR